MYEAIYCGGVCAQQDLLRPAGTLLQGTMNEPKFLLGDGKPGRPGLLPPEESTGVRHASFSTRRNGGRSMHAQELPATSLHYRLASLTPVLSCAGSIRMEFHEVGCPPWAQGLEFKSLSDHSRQSNPGTRAMCRIGRRRRAHYAPVSYRAKLSP